MSFAKLINPMGDDGFEESKAVNNTLAEFPHQAHEKQHWVFSSFMTVGYILGTGVLVLPSAMSGLGYILGIVTCFLFAALSMYIGLLLGRLRNDFHPHCVSYKMLAKACIDSDGLEKFLEFLTCINWFMTMALYILTAVHAFQSAFYNTSICGYWWGLMCVGILTPFMLFENMKSIEMLATISDVAAIIIIILVLSLLATQGDEPKEHEHHIWPKKSSFLDAYNPISSFLFAYQGQSIFLEVMDEMKDPREWPKSVYLSHIVMAVCYAVTALTGYYFKGDSVPAFLPSGLKNGPGKVVINLLVAYHVLVAYLINNIPLVAMLKRKYMSGSDTPKIMHFGLSMFLLFGAWFLTNLIPFFADMVNIIGALCGSPIMIGLPPMFYYYSCKATDFKMSNIDKVICAFLFFVLFPFTFCSGMVAAFKSLVDNWVNNGPPFTCYEHSVS